MKETLLERVLREEVDSQVVRLELQLELLDRMFRESAPYASSVPLTLLVASILKVRQSCRAVKLLAEEGLVEDILAIGRTLIEVTVNATYLQCVGEKELGRYLAFHPELRHRHGGMLQQGSGSHTGRHFVNKISDVVASLLPLGNGSKADPSWTNRSFVQRAQISDRATNIPVMSLLVSRCYLRGDAAVHGTMGALDSFVKAVRSGEMPTREDRFRELSEALFGVNLAIMTFSLFLNEFFQLGLDEAMDQVAVANSTTRSSLPGH